MVTFTLNNSKLIYYSTILCHLNPMKNKRRIQITEAANFSYALSVFYDLCKVGPDSTTFFYYLVQLLALSKRPPQLFTDGSSHPSKTQVLSGIAGALIASYVLSTKIAGNKYPDFKKIEGAKHP